MCGWSKNIRTIKLANRILVDKYDKIYIRVKEYVCRP